MNPAHTPAPRLAEVMHYVIARSVGLGFGRVKLNKTVYAADREFYRRFGRTITGAESYEKQTLGPVPNGVLKVFAELSRSGVVADREVLTPIGPRREYITYKEPPVSVFSPEEIDVLNLAIQALDRVNAQEASDQTHDALWEEVDFRDQIPIKAAAFVPGEVDADVLAWATA